MQAQCVPTSSAACTTDANTQAGRDVSQEQQVDEWAVDKERGPTAHTLGNYSLLIRPANSCLPCPFLHMYMCLLTRVITWSRAIDEDNISAGCHPGCPPICAASGGVARDVRVGASTGSLYHSNDRSLIPVCIDEAILTHTHIVTT